MACAVVGVGIVEADEIDRLNIYWATMKAMTLAVDAVAAALGHLPGHVLVDGNRLPRWGYVATPIVGGDALAACIAAASIVAKHTRDTIMIRHAEAYPHYDRSEEHTSELQSLMRTSSAVSCSKKKIKTHITQENHNSNINYTK